MLSGALLALSACGRHEPPQPILSEQCAPISGAQPVALNIEASTPGTLRVMAAQRGVSVVLVALDQDSRAPGRSSISPIDRFGVATLTLDVTQKQSVPILVRTRDSSEIVGEVCLSADKLSEHDPDRLRAERAFAAAGQMAHAARWPQAFELYGSAARAFDSIDRRRAAEARHAMSWIDYWNLRDDEGAYVLAAWARADFGANADAGLQSSLLALQASTLLESGRLQPEERLARVSKLLQLAEERAKRSPFGVREQGRFEILRGFMDFQTGQSAEASRRFTHAAELCESLRDWECAARARQNMAALSEEARDFPAALQAYQRALSVLPPDLDLTLSADIQGNYGRLLSMSGLFRPAEESHRTSVRLHARLSDCDGTRMAVARLGTLLVQVGNVSEGRAYLGSAASLSCASLVEAAKLSSATAPLSAAQMVSAAERDDVCIERPAVETLSQAGKVAVFSALLGLHDVARLESDIPQAERCLTSAGDYAATARTRLRLANAEGATLLERRQASKANASFSRGLEIADGAKLSATHENRSVAYLGLARAALLSDKPGNARTFAARALTLGAARGDLRQVTDALQLTARSFSAERNSAEAASILRVAADLIEQVPIDDLDAEQRATWLATQHVVFAELTTLLANEAGGDEARTWQAFAVSERGRARSLRYAVSQASDIRATSSSEPASTRYRDLMGRITELGREAQATDSQAMSIGKLSELIGKQSMAEVSLAALQAQLAALDATIVEYAAGEDSMLAFVVSAQDIRVVPLGSRSEIAAAAADLYERVRNPEAAASDIRRGAERLARLALWPLADALTSRRVIFIPDDALHTVPFAVLPASADENAAPIIQRMEITVMPSTVFIARAAAGHAKPEAAPRLELIGDPVFRAADWQAECHRVSRSSGTVFRGGFPNQTSPLPQLPGSRTEVNAIAELARQYTPRNEVHSHLRCEATPQALRAAAATNPALLHIATHGFVDAYRPRLSALVLTPDAGSNGGVATFGLLDILQMKIASRLVVLSACDTSRGRLLPGEGVLGPAQAFLQAGAASVVASYWRIPDEATARFMRTFYHHLLVDHLSAAAALREAQLEYVRAGETYDWAAFALFGWPDTRL